MSDLRLPDRFRPNPRSLIDRSGTPATISGWKAVADGFLTHECCAFHRNVEISSRDAWMYRLMPAFKWAGMAAIASHHVRLALFPLRLDTDRTGYVDIPRSLVRPGLLLMEDVNTIRATNNAIFDDIFWVHFAYVCADDGIECLRALLGPERHYAPILSGFEAIDQGRRVLAERSASAEDRQTAEDLIWAGNVQLLEHEQRALVQPNFDRLSCAFARLISIGSATTFEVRGIRRDVAYFTSFYLSSLPRAVPHGLSAWPRITRFDDRWRWVVTSVVPRFRRFDADTRLIDATLRRILAEARASASTPCVVPRVSPTESRRRTRSRGVLRRPAEWLEPRRVAPASPRITAVITPGGDIATRPAAAALGPVLPLGRESPSRVATRWVISPIKSGAPLVPTSTNSVDWLSRRAAVDGPDSLLQ